MTDQVDQAGLSGAIQAVHDAVVAVKNLRDHVRIAIGVGLVLVFILSVAVVSLFWDIRDREHDRCVQDQARRADIIDSFTFLADTLVGPNPSPETQARRDAFLDELVIRFPIQEC